MSIAVQNIMHVNLNVTRLQSAVAFFVETLGLQTLTHMRAEPQDGAGMGLAGRVQWDGYSVHDHRAWAGTMLDLLEWQLPPTAGRAQHLPHRLGLSHLLVDVPDVDAVHKRLAAAGVSPIAGPAGGGADGTRLVRARNADGSLFELRAGGSSPELAGIAIGCSDLSRSVDWYCGRLGFVARGAVRRAEETGAAWGIEGVARYREVELVLPAQPEGFCLRLQQWEQPGAARAPGALAHEAGFYRVALGVTDMQSCYQGLLAAGADCPWPPVWLDMGPDVPIDGLWALFFRDPDGACVELIQFPEVRGWSADRRLHERARAAFARS